MLSETTAAVVWPPLRQRQPSLVQPSVGDVPATVCGSIGVGHAVVGGRRVEGNVNNPVAQRDSVTALDIVLEPDATMLEQASTVNARLLGVLPTGLRLDAAQCWCAAGRQRQDGVAAILD